jgi:hypothetical protein
LTGISNEIGSIKGFSLSHRMSGLLARMVAANLLTEFPHQKGMFNNVMPTYSAKRSFS